MADKLVLARNTGTERLIWATITAVSTPRNHTLVLGPGEIAYITDDPRPLDEEGNPIDGTLTDLEITLVDPSSTPTDTSSEFKKPRKKFGELTETVGADGPEFTASPVTPDVSEDPPKE